MFTIIGLVVLGTVYWLLPLLAYCDLAERDRLRRAATLLPGGDPRRGPPALRPAAEPVAGSSLYEGTEAEVAAQVFRDAGYRSEDDHRGSRR